MPAERAAFIAIVISVTVIIGLSKGGLGGILGTLATPLMALVVPADQAIGLLLPILIVADLFAVLLHWRKWNNRLALLLLPGAIVGVTIGTLFITNAPTDLLKKGMGVIALLFAVYKLYEDRILGSLRYEPRDWHGLLAGTSAGFGSALAHTGGPPVSIYLLLQRVTPAIFIATSAIFFAVLNWIKVPYYLYADLLTWQRFLQIAWVLPLIPFAVWLGRWMSRRINRETFEKVIVLLLALSGILLIVT
jgi:uncharacterized membrane protein YfcA